MIFRIADTFTSAISKLSNAEKKAVKTTVYDIQTDLNSNGLRLHRLTGGRDKNFWSVSVNMDIRIIIHRDGDSVLVCYVDHHDDAYAWANDRKLEIHPTTGAAQLVEVAQITREVVIPVYINKKVEREVAAAKPAVQKLPLADKDGSWLMLYGVPEQWVDRLKAATEEELLVLVDHLPGEAAEAVIDIATGNFPPIPVQADPATTDPFEHPDALRRFRTIETSEELAAALDAPWDKWTIFLHPSQRELVNKDFSGPARVSGSAGTGKTVVALHRAVNLVRENEQALVLLTTFSDALARSLKRSLNRLLKHEPVLGERITVDALDTIGRRIYLARARDAKIVDEQWQNEELLAAAELVDHNFSPGFLKTEWHQVVDPWQLKSIDEYIDVQRIGRRTRLPRAKREVAWEIFQKVIDRQNEEKAISQAGIFQALAERYADPKEFAPYDHIIVDEAQDISVPQLRFLAGMVGEKPNGLFFSGDLGQRIFQAPFSWSSLGVKVRGRASTLRINYRTSHQIRSQADLLLSEKIADVDGNEESRTNTQSVFNGPFPSVKVFGNRKKESQAVGEWLVERVEEGVSPGAIAVFVRTKAQFDRAYSAIENAGLMVCELDESIRLNATKVTLSTMHLAKGLEFRAVAVMACDEDVIPDGDRINNAVDVAQIEEVYETERHLLYVACTRARDILWVSCAGSPSEFLDTLLG